MLDNIKIKAEEINLLNLSFYFVCLSVSAERLDDIFCRCAYIGHFQAWFVTKKII
jgi:hypothetical protein